MKFRFHRGGIKESMETVVDVNTEDELRKLLNVSDDITFQRVGYDHRIKWDTYYVIVDNMVMGMTDSNIFQK